MVKNSNFRMLVLVPVILFVSVSCSIVETERKDGTVGKIVSEMNGEPVVPREANRIAVPSFLNLTKREGIADYLTGRVRERISIDGRLAVVAKDQQPQLLLTGKVSDYQVQNIQYDEFGRPVKKRLRVVARVTLSEPLSGKLIFRNQAVQAFQAFSDIHPPITSELEVQTAVLNQLAERIKVQTIRGWYTELQTSIEKGKK